ncbi:hypothetical protein K3758_14720 [Sulfitobacter sp. W002]|uniref:CRISPR-associated protein Cas2 n=1 Tax=unclassified Sulfitobacter TaxID=196795 RepID=UPI000E775E38|nr:MULTISPECIES: CRISPR-associated protein Cas2 [unclassified Sulfitobacter]AYE87239.1 hypothetical protein B5M07_14570 [Sulfitobacter sp. D7]UWR29586.1 hypothetical protein K3758_14720 [Sulfitobacter sp. W002]|tara:strand:+ start:773 stop:1036 length:264 start_codon:yes stop_codon:yes gene_type:complete
MALFTVTYDLIAEKDYDSLIGRLKELDTARVQLSQWLLSADNSATEVKDHLAQYVDDDDKLMVIEFTKRPAFTKAIAGTNDWLDKHL